MTRWPADSPPRVTLDSAGAVDGWKVRALAGLDRELTPMSSVAAGSVVARLDARTRRKDGDPVHNELAAQEYVNLTARYPADIAEAALDRWTSAKNVDQRGQKRGQWWPAYSEWQETLDWAVAPRRALRSAIAAHQEAVPESDEPVTAEEMQEILAQAKAGLAVPGTKAEG